MRFPHHSGHGQGKPSLHVSPAPPVPLQEPAGYPGRSSRKRLRQCLQPDLLVAGLPEVEPTRLRQKGIRSALLDLDNTLLPWDSFDMSPEVIEWVARAQREGLALCLVSNAQPERIERALAPLELPYIALARKPLWRGFHRGLKLLNSAPHECAMIGDQLFTDVLGANLLGLFSIYIHQKERPEQRWMKSVRKVEKWLLNRSPRLREASARAESPESQLWLPPVE